MFIFGFINVEVFLTIGCMIFFNNIAVFCTGLDFFIDSGLVKNKQFHCDGSAILSQFKLR